MPHTPWRIWIDTGGTFTDCVARDPRGGLHRAKVLSSGALRARIAEHSGPNAWRIDQQWNACENLVRGWTVRRLGFDDPIGVVVAFDAARSIIELQVVNCERGGGGGKGMTDGATIELVSDEPAPIVAARLVTRTPPERPLPPIEMRQATTRGTNALLERGGARVALFITQGFGDLLRIGNQQRPDLFALNIVKPPPLYDRVVEVCERLDASGRAIVALDEAHLREAARRASADGVEVAAVALLHSYLNDEHERRVAAILHDGGFTHVSLSSQIAPTIRIEPRAQTGVVNAYLSPIIDDYLQSVRRRLRGGSLHVMTSAGGLTRSDTCLACETLLSGPAGGVNGAAAAGSASGFTRLIGFDMGGTSTDVARYDGDFEYQFEHAVGDATLLTPALAIETVAAGGGSICAFRKGELRVGPRSAGAAPGPACYGAGGPLTITDVNLLLGRIDADRFEVPLDIAASRRAIERLRESAREFTGDAPPPEQILDGLLHIANQRMAAAIAQISIHKGFDPAEYALVAFGGAGGQHACAVAEALGMRTVVLPRDASLLSAIGLGHAVMERMAHRQVLRPLSDVAQHVPAIVAELVAEARRELERDGCDAADAIVRRRIANLRLQGQDAVLSVDIDAACASLAEAFQWSYLRAYGHAPPRREIELESLRVVVAMKRDGLDAIEAHRAVGAAPATGERSPGGHRVRAFFDGRWREVAAYARDELSPGDRVQGPCLVLERRTTLVIEPGWDGSVDAAGAIILFRRRDHEASVRSTPAIVAHELFANRLMGVAQEMGRILERMAISTNVKERLDFSCAVLDADGFLLVNAPHMPVHLGAMGVCVRAVRDAIELRPGDVAITNHPAFGGSHLPDITVITPVFDDAGDGRLIAYVANRAHHAEIGGTRPGSMPPDATTLAEEGVVIAPTWLVRGGESRLDEIEKLLRGSPHPSRRVEDNLADLRAQLAANQRGADAVSELLEALGGCAVAGHMRDIRARGERLTREALSRIDDGVYEAIERLDDGSPTHVRIDLHGDRATIDFTGSAAQHPGNLNATPAIVRSAVIYVLRLLVGQALPLNEGIMDAVDVRIERGMLDPLFVDDPAKCPAVVGGNTETSQRIVDVLLKALRLAACSQGTMNNLLFGNESFSYYETICGGSGAGPGFHGCDAVHTHMTNTRITDAEVLEHRFPVRVERFAIRRGSGGRGEFRGGDGAVREIRFLQPASLSILSQHRVIAPFGMNGAEDAARGRQRVVRAGAEIVELRGIDACEMNASDRIIIETPGGGGWGNHLE